ncbi:LOW QUALITY PROTEIN: peptide methionine sulfoxide reductase MsrA-like [Aquila chrysaetos chrysaetos]|uniref:LOW QUALITY PROTEIN: peptide methionine sulfoxide reductase MsrA-like n=1 Tax=Aquila chrysaetos chrysaetos TaxID=223781 RepID=UPI0011766366|nr:LOW QUALITY PROTEIN: peptide methionine sulfoxide reductase MsrA-like [Aquila chrysaetos chrysaetos]
MGVRSPTPEGDFVCRGSRPRRDVPSLGGPWWVPGVLPSPAEALLGRAQRPPVAATHAVNGNPTVPSFPAETQMAIFGMGCFWGAEQLFWKMPGVFSTQVGYVGGFTPNPIYKEVYTGLTGHAEVVRVIFNPWKLSYKELLKVFWEIHDPTQGMQEDLSTQYRSVIYTLGPQQQAAALRSREVYRQSGGAVSECLAVRGGRVRGSGRSPGPPAGEGCSPALSRQGAVPGRARSRPPGGSVGAGSARLHGAYLRYIRCSGTSLVFTLAPNDNKQGAPFSPQCWMLPAGSVGPGSP